MSHSSRMNRYYKLKEKGVCVGCGKVPAKKGNVKCEKCLKKQKMFNTNLRKKTVKKWKKQEIQK